MTIVSHSNSPGTGAKRRAWIKWQLALRGTNLAQLSVENGLSYHCTRQALYRPYPKMEQLIARAIGTKASRIWPERYGKKRDASKISRTSVVKATVTRAAQ